MPNIPSGINAAAPLDASDDVRLLFSDNTHLQVLSRALDDMPSDFVSMDTCSIQVEYRQQGRVDDTLGLYVRIVNGATILAAQDAGGTFRQVNINITQATDTTTVFLNFPYVNTTASKAIWDGASVELRQNYGQTMGADGCHIEVDFVELGGVYTASGIIKVQSEVLDVFENVGRIPAAPGSPTTFGRLFQAPGNAGPWVRDSNGALYVALPDVTNNTLLAVWKRPEGGGWSLVGTVTNPLTINADNVRHIAGFMDGDSLHLTWQVEDSVGDDQRVCYVEVDVSTDSIGTPEVAFSGSVGVTINAGGSAIGARSDGTVLIMFRDYNGNALKLVRRTGVDTWAAAQTIEAASTGSAIAGVMVGDDFHVFYNGFSGLAGAWHRVYRSNNTVSSADQIVSTAATGNDLAGHAAIGDGRLFYGQNVGGTDPATFRAYSSDGQVEDETWSSDTLSTDVDKPASGASVGVVGAGGRVFAMWVDESEHQLHYAEWNSGTGSWGAVVDPGVNITDESLVSFSAWVDTNLDVHIGGLWGTALGTPANFFDIEVGGIIGTPIVKVQEETMEVSEDDLKVFATQILKLVEETIQVSESDLKVVGVAPSGHTGWGIPIGI